MEKRVWRMDNLELFGLSNPRTGLFDFLEP